MSKVTGFPWRIILGIVFVLLGGLALYFLGIKSFSEYGEEDVSLPICSLDTCANGTNAPCLYRDSPCQGSFCNQRCDMWRKAVLGVAQCSCQDFCNGRCFAPTCGICSSDELPIWLRSQSGPLGKGLLCCKTNGFARPCCEHGNAEKNTCCELERPKCDCGWSSSGIAFQNFVPPQDILIGCFSAFFLLVVPALFMYRRPLPRSAGPRGADIAIGLAYGISLIVAAILFKRKWQLKWKPAELLVAAATGHFAAFALTVLMIPIERTHLLFIVTRLPFERAVKLHRAAGIGAVFFILVHGILEGCALGLREMFTLKFQPYGFGNLPGVVAGTSSLLLLASSCWLIRRSKYESFLYAHRLFSGLIFFSGAFHCFYFATIAGVCMALYGASMGARCRRRSPPKAVLHKAIFGASESDSQAAFFVVDWRTCECNPLPAGTWFYLQCPSSREWHPYSVATEGTDGLGFIIKNMGEGTWSSKVVESSVSAFRLEGPYGGPGLYPGDCTSLLLIGGGVGLSPLARLWRFPPEGVARVELIWVVRCPEAVDWLLALLPDCLDNCGVGFIHIYVTRESKRIRKPSLTWGVGAMADDSMHKHPPSYGDSLHARRVRAQTCEMSDLRTARNNLLHDDKPSSWHAGCIGDIAEDSLDLDVFPACTEMERQKSWETSAAVATSELASLAANLSWDSNSDQQEVRPHLILHAGRPDIRAIFEASAQACIHQSVGTIACGPQVLVDDVRSCAFAYGFRFHSEEFSW